MTDIRIEYADWHSDQQALIDLRTQIFIDEQHVPAELEIDGKDPDCLHVKAIGSSGELIGTARLLPDHYIGRMCVLKQYRHNGVGGAMLAFLINHARQHEIQCLKLNAQVSALPFYQRYGFEPDSEIFMEAGIMHKHMTLTLAK